MTETENVGKTEIARFSAIFRHFIFRGTSCSVYMERLLYAFCDNLENDDEFNITSNTYRGYYTGPNDITKIAPILLRHRSSNPEFYQIVNALSDDIQDIIEKQIKENFHEIEAVDLGDICVELFWEIVSSSIHKKRNPRGKSIKLERMEGTEHIDDLCSLDEEIDHIIMALSKLSNIEELHKLSLKALKINQKVSDSLLCEDIKSHVTRYYRYIENEFKEVSKFTKIAAQIRMYFETLNENQTDQQILYEQMVNWIQKKTNSGNKKACEIVVSFFVQNCEVFHEISK